MSPHARTGSRVAIAGGGPSGAILGMVLARQGLHPVVFEAASAAQDKIGECLPPATNTLLQRLGIASHLGDGSHLRSYGIRSYWGADQAQEQDFLWSVHGAGWHLNRLHFEDLLARLAMASGVEWQYRSRVRRACRQDAQWELSIETPTGTQEMDADFLVDATGRRAGLARRLGARRVSYDRLVSLAMELEPVGSGTQDTFTLVEAVPSGWWYSSLLPGGRLVVMYLTDHDLPAFQRARRFEGWWDMLRHTCATWSRVREHRYRPRMPLRVLPAHSARLTTILGNRWLAVGDAAAAHDPLSSHGITSAMGSAYYAARAIVDLLDGHADAGMAYLDIVDKAYAIYRAEQQSCYAAEGRWQEHLFWSRRREPPVSVQLQASSQAAGTGTFVPPARGM